MSNTGYRKPIVGETVQYVATDRVIELGDGSKMPDVRAMIVTGLEFDMATKHIRTNGMVFRNGQNDVSIPVASERFYVEQDEENHFNRGTWHFRSGEFEGLEELLLRFRANDMAGVEGELFNRVADLAEALERWKSLAGPLNSWLSAAPKLCLPPRTTEPPAQ